MSAPESPLRETSGNPADVDVPQDDAAVRPRLRLAHRLRHRPGTWFGRWGRLVALALLAILWLYTRRAAHPPEQAVSAKFDNAVWQSLADYAIEHGDFPLPEQPARLAFAPDDGAASGGVFYRNANRLETPVSDVIALGIIRKGVEFEIRNDATGATEPFWRLAFAPACATEARRARTEGKLLLVATMTGVSEGRATMPETREGFARVIGVEVHAVEAWILLERGFGRKLGGATLTPTTLVPTPRADTPGNAPMLDTP